MQNQKSSEINSNQKMNQGEIYDAVKISEERIAPTQNIIQNKMFDVIHITKEYIDSFFRRYEKYVDTEWVNIDGIINELSSSISELMSLNEFYNYAADKCASKISIHPDYNILASRICVDRLHMITHNDMLKTATLLYENVDENNEKHPLITEFVYKLIEKNQDLLKETINYENDYLFDYFGIRTLERSYLIKFHKFKNKIIAENPQQMIMRVSLGIHGNDMKSVIETYNYISNRYFTHATPTLFNSGTPRPQLASCFLLGVDDSLDNIFEQFKQMGMISKYAGGIGIHLSSVRTKGSLIRSTNGKSDGIIPLCIVLNKISRYVNQGGKRPGSISCFVEPWHGDIFEFVELRKANTGSDDTRARDLFLALWIPDLFMKRVEEDGMWSLMCPDRCPNLNKTYGDEFEKLYIGYENKKMYVKQVKAITLWKHILECQIETGFPYMLYKDNVNKKSNQMNIGTIRSSNLCVHEDTLVLTERGHEKIKTLENKSINVWNGNEWSDVVVMKTGENVNLIRVSLSNGSYLDCTPSHDFYVSEKNDEKPNKVKAFTLQPGDKLIDIPSLPIIEYNPDEELQYDENENNKLLYTTGYYSGNRSKQTNNLSIITDTTKINIPKRHEHVLNYMHHIESSEREDEEVIDIYSNEHIGNSYNIIPKCLTIAQRIKWLEGYVDGGECVVSDGGYLQINNRNKEFLIEMKLMLQTLGLESTIDVNEGNRFIYQKNSNKAPINKKQTWKLMIDRKGVNVLLKLEFCPKTIEIINEYDEDEENENHVTVVSVEDLNIVSDTYCFTEKKRNMGVFNGILTGQCAEITEYSDEKTTAVCNLASICLPRFIETNKENEKTFNHEKLIEIVRVIVRNLNKIIDVNFYSSESTRKSNKESRPIGIGIQGLADVYNIMGHAYESEEALQLNKHIFETIYYAAVDESKELAKVDGRYDYFDGSPFSEGKLQFHLWGDKVEDLITKDTYDWNKLIEEVKEHGTRNSLLTALMPTASTSQIMKCYESFEPYMTNIFVRTTLAGEFIVINENLVRDLVKLDMWTEDMRKRIIIANGSIQNIEEVPENIKQIYKTAFEIKLKKIIKQSLDRGHFVDQSQSMNLFMAEPNFDVLTSAHFYGWENGLKTGMYYLRSLPAVNPISFGIDIEDVKRLTGKTDIMDLINDSYNMSSDEPKEEEVKMCKYIPGKQMDGCLMCGS